MLAFIYVFGICVVATILLVAVDDLEPNRRYASVLKFLIVFVSVVAIARRLMPRIQEDKGPAGVPSRVTLLWNWNGSTSVPSKPSS